MTNTNKKGFGVGSAETPSSPKGLIEFKSPSNITVVKALSQEKDCNTIVLRKTVSKVVSKEFLKHVIPTKADVAIDAEWRYETNERFLKARFLSTQLSFDVEDKKCTVVLWNDKFKLPEPTEAIGTDYLYVCPYNPEIENPVSMGLFTPDSVINLHMFYSPKDPEAVIGQQLWSEWLRCEQSNLAISKTITKKRRVTGIATIKANKLKLTLVDHIGVANSSLDKYLISVGVDNPYKVLAKDKSKMDEFMVSNPSDFLRYACGDTMFLVEALDLKKAQISKIVFDSLGFDPGYTVPNAHFPMSSGALVNDVFIKWLHHDHRELIDCLLPLTRIPSQVKSRSFKNEVLLPRLGQSTKSKNRYLRDEPLNSGAFDDRETYYHPIAINSIPSQIVEHAGTTGVLNALVFGGRCVNENPNQTRIECVIDPDLSSCYGSALRSFILPIGGEPNKLVYDDQCEKRMSFGEFLEKHECELVDDTWQVYLSGFLNFEQDLIFSKLGTSPTQIEKTVRNIEKSSGEQTRDVEEEISDFDKVHVPAEMKLVRKELKYGVITSHSLKVLRKTASNTEWSQIKKLNVDTALWYSKHDLVTEDELITLMSGYNQTGLEWEADGVTPKRPKQWFPLPIEDFIGKFIDTRKSFKKSAKDDNLSTDKKEYFNNLQNGVKLFVNTLYGCLASPFFPIGNTVTANNITSKARTGVWMMAKALGSVQSITDGGMFDASKVRYLEPGKKPSLHILSDYERVNKHRSISVTPLLDVENWQETKKSIWNKEKVNVDGVEYVAIDYTVQKHVNVFWSNYDLELPFNVEVKYENTGDFAGYDGAADYLIGGTQYGEEIDGIDGFCIVKCRGTKKGHVKWNHLRDLALDQYTHVLDDGEVVQRYSIADKQIGVTQYQANPRKYDELELLPGDSELVPQYFRPNDNHLPILTVKEWEERSKAYSKLVREHQKDLSNPFGYTERRNGDLRLNKLLS